MKRLLLSDVHLQTSQGGAERLKRFTRFLRQLDGSRYSDIYILGDLFDFWFEYRHVIFSEYFDVLRGFADLRDQGVRFHMVSGNHDFWTGRFLHDQLGFELHQDRIEVRFGERTAVMLHDDGVNPRDRFYRVYRRFARNRAVIRGFSLLHPDWAMGIARFVSHRSRQSSTPARVAEGADILRDYADALMKDRGDVHIVICGHSHIPEITKLEAGLYINTGDWITHNSYIESEGTEFTLRTFDESLPA